MKDVFSMQSHTLRERVRRIIRGLSAPRDSGDRKYAVMALERIFGPSSISLILTGAIVAALCSMKSSSITQDRAVEITVMNPENVKMDDVLKDLPEEPPIDRELPESDVAISTPVDQPTFGSSEAGIGADAPASDAPLVTMAPVMTKSPLIMRGLYGNRGSAGARATALRAHKGTQETEDAVLRALRWLKKNQKDDGSWPGEEASAMTGFALLCYLGHGETPASAEFGATVEKAIKYLIGRQQGKTAAYSGNGYAHGIAAYAMCEAYAMTKIIAIRDSAEKALEIIIQGQQDGGGYNYNYGKVPRWDTSVAGWQFQALKAGKMAGLQNPGLEKSIEKGTLWLRNVAFDPVRGGFGYSGEGNAHGGSTWTMTGVGTLCLQLYGHNKGPEVRAGLTFLDPFLMKWSKETPAEKGRGKNNVYGWYYLTQTKFHDGGDRWNAWNKVFSKELTTAQMEDGHWEGGDHGGPVYTTTLCVLMLEVYYRHLPTYQKVEDAAPVKATSDDDVVVDVT